VLARRRIAGAQGSGDLTVNVSSATATISGKLKLPARVTTKVMVGHRPAVSPSEGRDPDEPPSASRDPLRGGVFRAAGPPQTMTVCRFAGGCLEASSSMQALRTREHPAGRTLRVTAEFRALLRGGRSVRRDTHQQHDEQIDGEPECNRGGNIGRHGGRARQTKRTLALLQPRARTQTRRARIARTRSRHRARARRPRTEL
jgi:hypothetical protein